MYAPTPRLAAAESLRSATSDPLSLVQWVQTAADGRFEARVVVPTSEARWDAVSGIVVQLDGPDDRRFRGTTDQQGRITLQNVPAGAYTLTARGRGMIAWYAMHVVGPNHPQADMLPTEATISPALISPHQFESIILPHLRSHRAVDHNSLENVSLRPILDQISVPQLSAIKIQNQRFAGRVWTATTSHGTSSCSIGLQPSSQSRVWLIADNGDVSQAISDDDGRFRIPTIQPGIYSLIAAGSHGLAALSFPVEEVPASAAKPNASDRSATTSASQTLVRHARDACDCSFQVAPMELQSCQQLLCEPCGGETVIVSGSGGFGGGAGAGGGNTGVPILGTAVTGSGGTTGVSTVTAALGAAASGGSFTTVDSFTPPAANTPKK